MLFDVKDFLVLDLDLYLYRTLWELLVVDVEVDSCAFLNGLHDFHFICAFTKRVLLNLLEVIVRHAVLNIVLHFSALSSVVFVFSCSILHVRIYSFTLNLFFLLLYLIYIQYYFLNTFFERYFHFNWLLIFDIFRVQIVVSLEFVFFSFSTFALQMLLHKAPGFSVDSLRPLCVMVSVIHLDQAVRTHVSFHQFIGMLDIYKSVFGSVYEHGGNAAFLGGF